MSEVRKAWDAANRDKNKLYAAKYRLKKKGLELPQELVEFEAELKRLKEEKKAATKARAKERKRVWGEDYRQRKNERYKERYNTDPEFRARENERRKLRLAAIAAAKPPKTPEEIEDRRRQRSEAWAKARKGANAKRHQKALEKAATVVPKMEKPKVSLDHARQLNKRKPGRLVALAGWMGW